MTARRYLSAGSLARRLVGQDNDAVRSNRLGIHQLHARLLTAVAKQRPAAPEHDREDHQAVFINQVMLHERLHELDAAVDEDIPARLLAKRNDASLKIAPQQFRVGPIEWLAQSR